MPRSGQSSPSPRRQPDPQVAAERLLRACPLRPSLALVLGSGFEGAVAQMRLAAEIPFGKLPGFPQPTVAGHAGRVLAGWLGGTPVLVLSGRAHFYEGHSMEAITFPVRTLAAAGVRDLLLTNAAGGIHRRLRPGDFMRLSDHINFMGVNPLRGPAASGGAGFVDLTRLYDARLGRWLDVAARRAGVRLRAGVYLAVSGPSYETPAEIRAFARLGADAVGMSTVPEAVVARQCGLAVAALSCITNLAAGRGRSPLSHTEVLEIGRRAQAVAARLLCEFARLYAEGQ